MVAHLVELIARQVATVDPATLKWSAAVLLAGFFGLVLVGLFQYQAYDRKWGLKLVLGMAGGVFVAGLGGSLHWTLGVLYGVGYLLTWLVWVLPRRLTGWRQHVLRGIVAALCLGPWLFIGATECTIVREFWLTGSNLSESVFAAWARQRAVFLLVFMLPGFFWMLLLVGGGSWWRVSRTADSGRLPRWRYADVVLLVLINLLGLNWYVAGRVDLFEACRVGDRWLVGYVVFSRPGSANHRGHLGWAPLECATMARNAAAVRLLWAAGADINWIGASCRTALHCAAALDDHKIVATLLAAGADVNRGDCVGYTPLDLAQDFGTPEGWNALRAAGAKTRAELEAVKNPPVTGPAKLEPEL